jgi:carboxymethylenebutenolidase
MKTRNERIEISVSDGTTMGGYLARPDNDDVLPGVIVYMEIFGVNGHIRDVTDRIAAEGFVALAPDYFHRTGPGIELEYTEAGMGEGMSHLGQLSADSMIADAMATIASLEARSDVGGSGIGAMGFCIGGHMTYLTACETGVKAAASYYGGGIAAHEGPGGGESTVKRTPGITGRIHCYFGGQDAMIPQAQVEAIKVALREAGTAHEVHVYEEADHGFNCDQRDGFDAEASKDAWLRTVTMFQSELA